MLRWAGWGTPGHGEGDAVDERKDRTSLQGLLGYLNFSEGRPDPRVVGQIDDAYASLADQGVAQPWAVLHEWLRHDLASLKTAGGAFRDAAQAEAVVELTFGRVLPEYRHFHADLLFHQTERDLFQPFFLARALEAVLAQGGPWGEERRVVGGALRQLNDFVGHRPVAILETRPRGEPYEHETVRPIPLFVRGAGVAQAATTSCSPAGWKSCPPPTATCWPRRASTRNCWTSWPSTCAPSTSPTRSTAGRITSSASGTPPHRQPGPLPALRRPADHARRAAGPVAHSGGLERSEALTEAAAVFAGTLLMAAAISGSGPGVHDSATTLATLVPRVARLRDAFYAQLLGRLGDPGRTAHGCARRPRHCASRSAGPGSTSTPTWPGSGRCNCNSGTCRCCSPTWATPTPAREEAAHPRGVGPHDERDPRTAAPAACWSSAGAGGSGRPAAGGRGAAAARHRLRGAGRPVEHPRLPGAVPDLQRRARTPSATSASTSWSVPSSGCSRCTPACWARRRRAARRSWSIVTADMKRLAAWWDQFATAGVSEVRPVHGGEAVGVGPEGGPGAGQLARARRGQRRPRLLARAPGKLPLAQGVRAWSSRRCCTRPTTGRRWACWSTGSARPSRCRWRTANIRSTRWPCSGCWAVTQSGDGEAARTPSSAGLAAGAPLRRSPGGQRRGVLAGAGAGAGRRRRPRPTTRSDLFGAAYEGVTYQDTTDDREGPVAGDGAEADEFDLEAEGERLSGRLHFLTTVARLWHVAARRRPEGRRPPSATRCWPAG